MRTHKRFVLLGSLLLAAGLLIAFTPTASTASAATASPASASAVASGPTTLTRLAQVVHVSVTTSVVAAPRDSAGDPCATKQRVENGTDVFGIVLYWFKMQTSWCWDYRTVTSHTTHLYWAVTGPGAAFGWAYISNSGVHFYCYVASGSTRQCSGNHEDATASFLNLDTLQTCLPFIAEDENYRGQFFSSGRSC